MDEHIQGWYEKCCERNLFSDNVADKMQHILKSIPPRITLLHGDFHEGNVAVRDGELVCVDLDKMGSGHPIFDLLGLYMNHEVIIERYPEWVEKSLGLTVERALAVKRRMLKTYYGITGDKLLQEYEDIVAKTFLFYRILFTASPVSIKRDEKALREYVEKYIPEFLDIANELPDMIKTLPI